jgi:hypothetical protein
MTRIISLVILLGGAALALAMPLLPVRGQEQPPEFGDARFAFHRSDDGYLRLDLRTGEVAACSRREAGWACAPVPDERAALDGEIARLQGENAALKNALLARGVPLPNGMTAVAPPSSPPRAAAEPPPPVPPAPIPPKAAPSPEAADRAAREDAEIERALNVMEKVWRRLVEMMMNIQRDMQKKG